MTTAERWRDITGYEGLYQVSDAGRVRSLDRVIEMRRPGWSAFIRRGKILKQHALAHGYLQVALYADGERTAYCAHRLVLETFVGPRPAGMEGCHGDGNPANNVLRNLRWDAPKANAADRIRHGTQSRTPGELSPNAKLTAVDIERVRDLRTCGASQQHIGVWIGASQTHIGRIIRGERWSHLQVA